MLASYATDHTGMASPFEFGLTTFGDITVSSDGTPLTHAQVIRDVVDQAVLAEGVGIDIFGVGEHHRSDFAISAPEVVLATVAGRTKRIRLCSATTILSVDDPVRVFERFSTLHAASGGRAEVIVGRGWFTEPFSLFGYPVSDYDALFEEKLGLLSKLIRQPVVSWKGTTRAPLVNRAIYPPIDEGRLKTWVAVGSTPESVLRAARYDMPMIVAVVGGEPARFAPLVQMYVLAFEKLGRPTQPVGVHSNGYIADSDERARNEFWAHYKPTRDRIGIERGWPPIERETFDVEVTRGSLFVGSPHTVARKIAATAKDFSASLFSLKYSQGTLPHDKLMRCIELYGTKVIPIVRQLLQGR
jgi:probable LLM family oxidoreductase